MCDKCFEAVEQMYGGDVDLRSKFKRRDLSKTVTRYVPDHLKVSAVSIQDIQGVMSSYLRYRRLETTHWAGGLSGGRWKKNWFVLKDRVLYTYKACDDTVAVDTLPVLGWDIVTDVTEDITGEGLCVGTMFQLSHQGSHSIVFNADNVNLAVKWKMALIEAIQFSQ